MHIFNNILFGAIYVYLRNMFESYYLVFFPLNHNNLSSNSYSNISEMLAMNKTADIC